MSGRTVEVEAPVIVADRAPTREQAIAAIRAFTALTPQIAKANARGKFPAAAMRLNPTGSHYDMAPFAVAMTQETWDGFYALICALPTIRAALDNADVIADAYAAGFEASGEGWNGEYPKTQDTEWLHAKAFEYAENVLADSSEGMNQTPANLAEGAV